MTCPCWTYYIFVSVFAFNMWHIHSNLPILGLINVLDMFHVPKSILEPNFSQGIWFGVALHVFLFDIGVPKLGI